MKSQYLKALLVCDLIHFLFNFNNLKLAYNKVRIINIIKGKNV